MQFVVNGPDVPDELIQSHLDGNLIFFCGAGISMPAGLPNFKDLVCNVVKGTGIKPNDLVSNAISKEIYDNAFQLLEMQYVKERNGIRFEVWKILNKKIQSSKKLKTHISILNLSQVDGKCRLVTTNYDRLFHFAAKHTSLPLNEYCAPYLPTPKRSRWDGVVFLHGLLPVKEDPMLLNNLVLTSGDFGTAYLTERWASKFISELFRDFDVCFIGYSLQDTVLKYMTDAISSDRRLGDNARKVWAFTDVDESNQIYRRVEWEAKGVHPILYKKLQGKDGHSLLHDTIQIWSRQYTEGIASKVKIVHDAALRLPSESSQEDDFVGRLLWAMSDDSGLPAKAFANLNPVPKLEWLLEVFSAKRFRNQDLARFDIKIVSKASDQNFSLVDRPARYDLTSRMSLFTSEVSNTAWDVLMNNLAEWLTRHLNDRRLFLWVISNGTKANYKFKQILERKLVTFSAPDGWHDSELELKNAPHPKLDFKLQILWRLYVNDKVLTLHNSSYKNFRSKLTSYGYSPIFRLEFREIIALKISVTKSAFNDFTAVGDTPNMHLETKLALSDSQLKLDFRDVDFKLFGDQLHELVLDVQNALYDGLILLAYCNSNSCNAEWDSSIMDLPSIEPHFQNRDHESWVFLIELIRDSWLHLSFKNPKKAKELALGWFEYPFPVFKRLAFYAAYTTDLIPPSIWLNWLLESKAKWLWSANVAREVFRVLAIKGNQLNLKELRRLENAILSGPIKSYHKASYKGKNGVKQNTYNTWHHLAKIQSSGAKLSKHAISRLDNYQKENPSWVIHENQKDEFSTWMEYGGFQRLKENHSGFESMEIAEIIQYISEITEDTKRARRFSDDGWRLFCQNEVSKSIEVLAGVLSNGSWESEFWIEAFESWDAKELSNEEWDKIVLHLDRIEPGQLLEIYHQIGWWLNKSTKSVLRRKDNLLILVNDLLNLDIPPYSNIQINGKSLQELNKPIEEAINHFVGHLTQSVLNTWHLTNPTASSGIEESFKKLFTRFCSEENQKYIHAKVILAAHLNTLFRVDTSWTEKNLLPLFEWNKGRLASAVWQGYMWSPSFYPNLINRLKLGLIETAKNWKDLGDLKSKYVSYLTQIGLENDHFFGKMTLEELYDNLDEEVLSAFLQTLLDFLNYVGDKRGEYLKSRVVPYYNNVFPKDNKFKSSRISALFARIVVKSDSYFPKFLTEIKSWLVPIERPYLILQEIKESSLCEEFPSQTLSFLDLIVQPKDYFRSEDLCACLKKISTGNPTLRKQRAFLRLELLCG